ncbi:hypothetical protein COJ18_27050 [Bacillus cereus]|uniref:hypothetical protein n=1 Tax=Bacillus cereus TaxID=1396 RepID=UPI000BF9B2A2|nr:hypothetical protein [Bacillus cereus]PFK30745.1 hypothetical protein COJ18_27050 [Bacillus cereus]
MLLKKLHNTYHNSNCSKEFEIEIVNELYSFIKREVIEGYKYLNPYKFAHLQHLSIAQTLKLFMYFCEDGPLEIQLFFECSSPNCVSERIFLNKDHMQDGLVTCEECDKDYDYDIIKHYVKAYFLLKDEYKTALIQQSESSNPNSTYNILNGMPDNLKDYSPSPSNSKELSPKYRDKSSKSEGENKVSIPIDLPNSESHDGSTSVTTLIQLNIDPDGKPITNSIDSPRKKVATRLIRSHWSTDHE